MEDGYNSKLEYVVKRLDELVKETKMSTVEEKICLQSGYQLDELYLVDNYWETNVGRWPKARWRIEELLSKAIINILDETPLAERLTSKYRFIREWK